ncbi:MAG: YSC84-related protein [Gammaproteobacteria bacterium]|nr:YSC84-related protein [Gammaproteobacteria bacterium]
MNIALTPAVARIALVFLLSLGVAPQTLAASAQEIDIRVDAALERFKDEVNGGGTFIEKAEGLLVFPDIIKAGIGIGGEYGEGALRIGGETVQYYSTAAASIGFQLGAQQKTVILVFLDQEKLKEFRASDGWEAGVDGSVALIEWGAGKNINTVEIDKPIVGFVFNNKGLMYNLTLEGTKITKIDR